MIIWKQNTMKKAVITEVEIQEAQEKINKWDAVQTMMTTQGWEYLMDELEEEISFSDSFRSIDPDFNKMLIRKGYCDGLRKPLQIIERIQKLATSSAKLLQEGLAQNEE